MSRWILDASAVLAYLRREPGWDLVERTLSTEETFISAVNQAEVITKLADKGLPKSDIQAVLNCLKLQVLDFGTQLALETGLLRPQTRAFGLSLGDRACLALAKDMNLPVLTTDQAWVALKLGVTVKVIRDSTG